MSCGWLVVLEKTIKLSAMLPEIMRLKSYKVLNVNLLSIKINCIHKLRYYTYLNPPELPRNASVLKICAWISNLTREKIICNYDIYGCRDLKQK